MSGTAERSCPSLSRIAAGDAKRLTILSLALDAGFASKSTFNVVFKKHTSQTPSDYRQTVGA